MFIHMLAHGNFSDDHQTTEMFTFPLKLASVNAQLFQKHQACNTVNESIQIHNVLVMYSEGRLIVLPF